MSCISKNYSTLEVPVSPDETNIFTLAHLTTQDRIWEGHELGERGSANDTGRPAESTNRVRLIGTILAYCVG